MKYHLNLLPYPIVRRQLIWRRGLQWLALGAIALPSVISFTAWKWHEFQSLETRVHTARQRYEPIAKLENEIATFDQRIAELTEREKLTLELSQNRSMVTLLGTLAEAARQSEGKLAIGQFDLQSVQTGNSDNNSDPESPPNQAHYRLTLGGISVDNVAIAQFVAALRDGNLFTRVQLTSTGTTTVNQITAKNYAMQCEFQ